MLLPPEFKRLLSAPSLKRVEYLVVGGYAVIFHGYGERRASVLHALCKRYASAMLARCYGDARQVLSYFLRILFVFSWCLHGVLPLGSSPTFGSNAVALVGFLHSTFCILASAFQSGRLNLARG